MITFSVVSHGQGHLINNLFNDFDNFTNVNFNVILTINIDEELDYTLDRSFPLFIIHNRVIKGFGANHNAAFVHCTSKYFCVINPDIRIESKGLLNFAAQIENKEFGVIAPLVMSPLNKIDNTARYFPTFKSLVFKVFKESYSDYNIQSNSGLIFPDWVGGMFMLFRSDFFSSINGFDQHRFFMYYEDVDICKRIRSDDSLVVLDTHFSVVHFAQRKSHFNLSHFFWHLKSSIRFLFNI